MSYSYGQQLSKKWLGRVYTITQAPGAAHSSTRRFYKYHKGWDFATPEGTVIRSPIRGKVVFAGYDKTGWGNRVGVFDPQTGKTTYLSHLSKINVKAGQDITPGTIIGLTGGRPGTFGAGNTTGPHLDITEYYGNMPMSYGTNVKNMAINADNVGYTSVAKKPSYADLLRNFVKGLKKGQKLVAYGDYNTLDKLVRQGKIKGRLYKLS